jgi:hypothetical protein
MAGFTWVALFWIRFDKVTVYHSASLMYFAVLPGVFVLSLEAGVWINAGFCSVVEWIKDCCGQAFAPSMQKKCPRRP